MEFELDPAKSAANRAKHGIDFVEAQKLWRDGSWAESLLQVNLGSESRFLAIGQIEGKHWTAICTPRGKAVRIISVRRSRKEEIRYYEGS